MEDMQRAVEDFRRAMDLDISPIPRTLSPAEAKLHIQLIRDEFEKELVPALENGDLVEIYDGAIDVIYFLLGMLSNAGMDLEPGFWEVHESNMSKMDPETGKAIKAVANDPSGEPEGKVLKGPAYFRPNLEAILNDTYVFGPQDDRVINNTVPLTFGIGGPKIGTMKVEMDKDGNLVGKGQLDDPNAHIPMINGLSILEYWSPEVIEPEPEELEPAKEQPAP